MVATASFSDAASRTKIRPSRDAATTTSLSLCWMTIGVDTKSAFGNVKFSFLRNVFASSLTIELERGDVPSVVET